MKKVAWILAVVFILSLFPAQAIEAVEAEETSAQFVLEDYENGTIGETAKLKGASTQAEVIAGDTAGGSLGALHVTTSSDFGAVSYDFGSRKDYTYDISAWIKVAETPLIDEVHFIIYNLSKEDGKTSLYRDIVVKNAGLTANKWVKVTAVFECDGIGKQTGGENYETIPVGTAEIRIGSGRPAETMSSGVIDYVMDDFVVMPREKYVPQDGEIIANGSFEEEDYLNKWYYDEERTEVTQLSPGASGTDSAVNIQVTDDWGTITQNVDIRFGRTYTISFWAKATSPEAVGLQIEFILDRSRNKTDSYVPPYEYITDSDNLYLTEEWRLYEMTYSNNLRTSDNVQPTFYFRVGSGQEIVSYAVDEVSIQESGASNILQSTGYLSGYMDAGRVLGYASVQMGLVQNSVYQVLVPFEGDYAILNSGRKAANELNCALHTDADMNDIRMTVQAMDHYGNAGPVYSTSLTEYQYDVKATAQFHENIWNDDIKKLTGTVSYASEAPADSLVAVAAVYGPNGQLLQTSLTRCEINAGEGTAALEIEPNETAQSAKLFLWEEESLRPVKVEDELTKINDATFIYVDPVNGNSANAGTFDAPVATITQARIKARNIIKSAETDVYVVFYPGEYKISKTLKFNAQDFSENVNLIYTSLYKSDKAIFTGGTDVTDFQLYDEAKGIYRAYVGEGVQSRQLFVNGVRAVKARSVGPLSGPEVVKAEDGTPLGIKTTYTRLKDYKRVDDLELVFYEQWTNPRCQVSSITDNGDGTITLVMDAVGWKAMSNKGGTSVTVPEYIENAIELLDVEGEWYLDSVEGYVYYKPRFFEDLSTARVILPTTEKLVSIEGASVQSPIKNIKFDNIEFAYATWNRPSTENGHSDAQNNHIRQNGDRLVDGTIEVKNAYNVDFTNCSFNRLGTTALRLTDAIRDCDIDGNEFFELSAGAINLGDPANKSDNNQVVNPTDPLYFITDNTITNNYIHKIGVDFMSAAGLSVGFPKNTTIANNELYDMPYSGMHIGYGWASYEESGTGTENLKIVNNYIHNVLNDKIYDGGGIYTLGMTGGTPENPNIISENYIYDVGNHHGALYTDEGSAFWSVTKNVIDLSVNSIWRGNNGSSISPPKWIHVWTTTIHDNVYTDNYSTTLNSLYNGTNCVFEDPTLLVSGEWPDEAVAIMEKSGVQPNYHQYMNFGIQRIENIDSFTMSVGQSSRNYPVCLTTKNAAYSLNGVETYVQSSNPEVASVEGNMIHANSAGTAEITYYFLEQGILHTSTTTVTVQ